MTASEAEHELKDFEFKGPGWYIYKSEAMLVVPTNRPKEKTFFVKCTDPNEKFYFHVYGSLDNVDSFGRCATAPTRVDERE